MTRSKRCWILGSTSFLAASVALASSFHGPIPKQEEIDVRSLPSMVVEWEWRGTVDQWRLDGGVVFKVGGGHLSALDAASGEELWAHELAQQCSCSKLELLPSRIVAGIDGRAILVDRASGALVADVALGSSITRLIAEPLAFAYRGALDMEGLVRLDEVTGVVLARLEPREGIGRIEAVDDRLIVTLQPAEGADLLVGLDAGLRELWRRPLPENGSLRHEDDELFVRFWRDGSAVRLGLDPETGELRPRPEAAGAGDSFEVRVDPVAGGLVQVIRNGQLPRLVRPGERGRRPLWEIELPVGVSGSVEWGDRVVLSSRRWGGRAVVLIVDREDGEIVRTLAGPRQMSDPRPYGDLLLSETATGLAAVRLDRFGPPEAAAMSVAETVQAILADLRGDEPALEPYDVRRELEELGEGVLPHLVEEIPTASDEVVEMIASLVARHAYEPAAGPLAARATRALAEPVDPDERWKRTTYLGELATALAAAAGPRQVPVLEAFIEPGSGLASGRAALLATLGRAAPERALAFIERLRARYATADDWYESPRGGPWIEIASLEPEVVDLDELVSLESSDKIRNLMLRGRTVMAGSADGGWVVFPSPVFGARDLWAAPVDGEGHAGEAFYLGAQPTPPRDPETAGRIPLLEARLTAGSLEVGFTGGEWLAVELGELTADGDGDGLTDRLEIHLGLDPGSADSDADGVPDASDRAPSGGRSAASREERAFLALHEAQALISRADLEGHEPAHQDPVDLWAGPEHLFLVDAPPLEWRAGPRATFRVAERATEDCEAGGYRVAAQPPRSLGAGELAIEMFLVCPPVYGRDATGALVLRETADTTRAYVLRETDGGWVLSGIGE